VDGNTRSLEDVSNKPDEEPEAEKFDARLEAALRKNLKMYFDFFDKSHPNDETSALGWKDSETGKPSVNPDFVSAYVSLRAERRATRENARLQRWLIIFAAISAVAVAVPTAIEVLRYFGMIP
jgi:hypothetical protein